MAVSIDPTPAYLDEPRRKDWRAVTQRAVDVTKVVIPITLAAAAIVALAGGIFWLGGFSNRMATAERSLAAAPTVEQLGRLQDRIEALERGLAEKDREHDQEVSRLKDELATEKAWRDRLRDDLAQQGWKSPRRIDP